MTRTKAKAKVAGPQSEANDELNAQFNALLREAAEKREERALVQATANAAAARQESADLLALARTQSRRRTPAER